METQEYTEDTVLTYGKYKLIPLKNVPPKYLYAILTNKSHDPLLNAYVEKHQEEIKKNHFKVLQAGPVKFKCSKETFATEALAKERVKAFKSRTFASGVKPHRVYYCSKCSGWHHTSQSVEQHNNHMSKFEATPTEEPVCTPLALQHLINVAESVVNCANETDANLPFINLDWLVVIEARAALRLANK